MLNNIESDEKHNFIFAKHYYTAIAFFFLEINFTSSPMTCLLTVI